MVIFNTALLFLDKFLKMSIGLFIGVWVIRYLGPTNYGVLSYAQAFVALFAGIATLAIDSIVVRELVKDPQNKDEILGTAFCVLVFSSVISIFCIVICIFIVKPDDIDIQSIVIILACGIFFQCFNVIDYWFQANLQSRNTVIAKNFVNIIDSLMKVVLIIQNSTILMFAIINLTGSFLNAMAMIIMYLKTKSKLVNWKFNSKLMSQFLTDSYPLAISLLSYLIYSRIDQLMIGSMLDTYSVGIYSAANKIIELYLSLGLTVVSSLYPVLISSYEKNKELFLSKYQILTSGFTGGALILFFVNYIWGESIINILYGNKYNDSYYILVIQSIGLIFMYNAALRSSYITITNKQQIILITAVISAIINLCLNYVLLPRYGVVGAAWAMTITQMTALLIFNVFFQHTRRLFNIQIKGFCLAGLINCLRNDKI